MRRTNTQVTNTHTQVTDEGVLDIDPDLQDHCRIQNNHCGTHRLDYTTNTSNDHLGIYLTY